MELGRLFRRCVCKVFEHVDEIVSHEDTPRFYICTRCDDFVHAPDNHPRHVESLDFDAPQRCCTCPDVYLTRDDDLSAMEHLAGCPAWIDALVEEAYWRRANAPLPRLAQDPASILEQLAPLGDFEQTRVDKLRVCSIEVEDEPAAAG